MTITGFKSFATKTVLNLEPGIIGIVGPNGSGKSNFADAIRWALGEQSKGRLRLDEREAVIFAGTEQRARASYAEVVLLFDNEDGAFPLDLTEVEIARRLYRSGEAEYRLAGRIVRLSDIQTLLAQAGCGAGTYAVIGQGMIDSFLLSSPTERKQLFDEAAGIRGPELKREAALRKLSATTTNLTRLRDIVAELAPRLKTLESAVSVVAEQQALSDQVKHLHQTISAVAEHQWTQTELDLSQQLQQSSATAHRLRHDQSRLRQQLAGVQASEAALAARREQLQALLSRLEQQRDQLGLELSNRHGAVAAAERAQTQLAAATERLAQAQAAHQETEKRTAELTAELDSNAAAAERALRAVERSNGEVTKAQDTLVELRQGTVDGTRDQYVDHALQILRTLAQGLNSAELSDEQIKLLVHKAGRLLSHASRTGAAELLTQLQAAQKRLEAAMNKRETAVEHQTNITITRRSLEIDLVHQREAVQRAAADAAHCASEQAVLRTEVAQLPQLQDRTKAVIQELAEVTAELEQQRDQIRQLSVTATDAARQAIGVAELERLTAAHQAVLAEQTNLRSRRSQAKTELQTARRQAKAWGVTAANLANQAPSAHRSLAELQAELVRAEAMLEAKAAAFEDQTAEYQTITARYADLTAQITDLELASADLEQVIAQLDELIKIRFRDNFHALNTQFKAYTTRLFGGGNASLELQESEDGSYGVTIKASPKGKRLTQIAALSGGERALAGVALLAAILHVNPSPFVVLDEIDAALDEANSTRLADILGELQGQSQLIVITHNHQTMRTARVLFGITTNEHHVSRLLSMRLEEATALAAR